MKHYQKIDPDTFALLRKGRLNTLTLPESEKTHLMRTDELLELTDLKNNRESFLTRITGIAFEEGSCTLRLAVLNNGEGTLTAASKFISLVLRHKPSAAGITLDEHGWADTEALLAGMADKYPISRAALEQIVAEDDKQRYSFNDDKTRIRANQGHSVPVDIEPEELIPPEFLYHGTAEQNVPSITLNGLVAKERLYVHLSADLRTAAAVGLRHGKPVVYRVRSGDMQKDGIRFYRAANGVWLTKYVPAFYLDPVEPDEIHNL